MARGRGGGFSPRRVGDRRHRRAGRPRWSPGGGWPSRLATATTGAAPARCRTVAGEFSFQNRLSSLRPARHGQVGPRHTAKSCSRSRIIQDETSARHRRSRRGERRSPTFFNKRARGSISEAELLETDSKSRALRLAFISPYLGAPHDPILFGLLRVRTGVTCMAQLLFHHRSLA